MGLEDIMIAKRDVVVPPGKESQHEQTEKLRFEFTKRFIEQGGFSFLFDFFTVLKKFELEKEVVKTKALGLTLRLLGNFFTINYFPILKDQATPQQIEVLLHETLVIIESFSRSLWH